MLSKAVDWDYLDSNVAAKVKKFKLNNARERVLDADEARRLIECAAPALQPVLIIALKTGMRRGEILSLKWSAVNFIKSFIQIKDTKSGEPRKVPLSPAAREALKALPRIADFIFYNAETKTHLKSVVTAFETACARAEIKGLRFHDLRHTFATWYMERGGDVVALSKILGHHSLQMTLRYCNPTEGAMLQAVEKMDAILGKVEAETGKNSVIEKAEATVNQALLSN
jgi:integrase/recombinase XerD